MPKVIDLETHRQLLLDMNRLRQRLREYSISNDMLGLDAAKHLDAAYDSMQGDLKKCVKQTSGASCSS